MQVLIHFGLTFADNAKPFVGMIEVGEGLQDVWDSLLKTNCSNKQHIEVII